MLGAEEVGSSPHGAGRAAEAGRHDRRAQPLRRRLIAPARLVKPAARPPVGPGTRLVAPAVAAGPAAAEDLVRLLERRLREASQVGPMLPGPLVAAGVPLDATTSAPVP